ncbi:hypothetical protein OG725_37330 [Streptomyces sp. NBC_01213]|uniref:hypothetical protein n=1 Tax=Streptomyces sp. NBC_01213 TaxID=2903776 RepID=UPI00352F453D|nr:hypothetical protein OG725_24385 [Streptomyces sp. NBC_01213]WSQ82766.1 hypothetical protein OG725_37330 [Streptomyces sp. NBC_01213]
MTSVETASPRVTAEELFTTPLTELLTQLNAEIGDASITDPNFYGGVIVRTGHPILLLMPTGRPDFERDATARKLLADAIGLDLPPLPGSLETLVLTDFTDKANRAAARP